MKCMPRNLVIVLEPRMNPPHSHRASELPMFDGITVNRLVMTVAPQKLDRLVLSTVQRRSGPYIVGWFGLIQSIDDGIKL